MLAPADQRLVPAPAVRSEPLAGRVALWFSAALILAALGVKFATAPQADHVTAQAAIQMESVVLQSLPLQLQPLPDQEIPGALASLNLTAQDRQSIEQTLEDRSLHMALLSVYDSGAEDGDVIRVEALGLGHIIHLTKRPITVPVFLPASGRISITAVDQGLGGGVTLGVLTNGTPLPFAPMTPGQTINIPATVIDQP